MIEVIDSTRLAGAPASDGQGRVVLGPDVTGTRVRVEIREVAAGATCRVEPGGRTQVAYVLEGTGATLSHTRAGSTTGHQVSRRAGVYLEPGEEAAVVATGGPLVLLLVSVPKYLGRPTDGAPPTGYVFEEAHLRSLVDEKRIRERTFWVNKETGLSASWDLQIGRMAYAPNAYSPRHEHHASKTSEVTPEHFYFIEKGTGEVKHDDGSLPVGPGSLVLIPSGEWHQLVASESGFDYIEFQAPFDFATTMDHDPQGKNWYIKGTDDGTGKPQRWVQS
jgi:mannose-6-phosphate isomerase-like protein (cupin superfamily)